MLFNSLVAHGKNTGEEFAHKFSNTESSYQSSLRFYITETTYNGENGYSLKLLGMDNGFNDNALRRAIVMHGADYVSEDSLNRNTELEEGGVVLRFQEVWMNRLSTRLKAKIVSLFIIPTINICLLRNG